jgi:thiosulfate dehydrogenase
MRTSFKIILAAGLAVFFASHCTDKKTSANNSTVTADTTGFIIPDTSKIPHDQFGDMVRYGRELMVKTAYYIGPDGIAGKFLGNKMNCSNCHQEAGTKPFAFNLLMSHANYPQYRAREGRVLTLAERINNCVMRPHNGKPLPLDSKEMIAILSYLKWINSQIPEGKKVKGEKNLAVEFPDRAADPLKGEVVYATHCKRCHGDNGQGLIGANMPSYTYPLLWGDSAYQPGSSMHRVIKQAQWLKGNMPYDSAKWNKPILTDEEALDVAAFVNDDRIHRRPNPPSLDYPHPGEKAIDYGEAPFIDTFSAANHKFGPYKPIISYWKSKNLKPTY